MRIRLNDSRTASFRLSMHDEASKEVRPLDRAVRIFYHKHLVFNGVITTPAAHFQAGHVIVNAHDPTLKLKRANHRYGDIVVVSPSNPAGGYTLDAQGARDLHRSADPSAAQLARGVKPTGIFDGKIVGAAGTAAIKRQAERGSGVWDTLSEITLAAEGFDMEWEPTDAKHGSQSALWTPGRMVAFNAYENQGIDRSQGANAVKFYYGYGRDNLLDFTLEPDGEGTTNYAVAVSDGGQTDEADTMHRALSHVEQSWLQYGIYQRWEAVSAEEANDPNAVLKAITNGIVGAYGFPPQRFTLELPDERDLFEEGGLPAGTPYRYLDHFGLGDRIYATAKKGYWKAAGRGRVLGVTLNQQGKTSRVRTTLECVPTVIGGMAEIGAED